MPEMKEKIEKNFLFFKIIAFDLGLANSHKLQQDTLHRQSMC